ncbi:head-tail adaptor protein [Aerococcaceae bacterium NML191219]|nr:head-tail adaptor protein [Aerococcaceae bacterium NML191219]
MKISSLNQKIEVQEKEITTDEIGNRIESWKVYHQGFCRVDSQMVHEKDGVVTVIDDSKMTFILRWSHKLNQINAQSYRILFLGNIYNIIGVDFMNFKNKNIKLYCQRSER